jgi:CheY-like chemotaxis protein
MSSDLSRPSTNVLVVEDEMVLRMRAVDIVEDAGFTAVEAANADQALSILESRSMDLIHPATRFHAMRRQMVGTRSAQVQPLRNIYRLRKGARARGLETPRPSPLPPARAARALQPARHEEH